MAPKQLKSESFSFIFKKEPKIAYYERVPPDTPKIPITTFRYDFS